MQFLDKVQIEISLSDVFIFSEWAIQYNESLSHSIEQKKLVETHPKAEMELESAIRFISAFINALAGDESEINNQLQDRLLQVKEVCEQNQLKVQNVRNLKNDV